MLRMEYEKEVVLSIRHRIEMHEQEQQFNSNAPDEDYTEVVFEGSHVRLGSRQRGLKFLSYEQDLEEMIGFHGLGDNLARFLRDHTQVQVYGSDFSGDGFEGHQFYIYWCKVMFSVSLIKLRLINNRSSLIIHAKSHSIAKKRPFTRQKSFMFRQHGADRGRDTTL